MHSFINTITGSPNMQKNSIASVLTLKEQLNKSNDNLFLYNWVHKEQ